MIVTLIRSLFHRPPKKIRISIWAKEQIEFMKALPNVNVELYSANFDKIVIICRPVESKDLNRQQWEETIQQCVHGLELRVCRRLYPKHENDYSYTLHFHLK